MRVLILRPEPGNAATAAAVRAMGLEPVVIPLFEVRAVAWSPPDPDQFDAVVMTSANAARHGGEALARYTHLPLYAVGEATAAAARAAGFAHVVAGAGGGDDLSALLDGRRTLHVSGRHAHSIGAAASVAVYESRAVDVRIDQRRKLSGQLALIHSPRAGAVFAALAPDRPATTIVAISDAAAATCGTGWHKVVIADHPLEAAMLAALEGVCSAREVANATR